MAKRRSRNANNQWIQGAIQHPGAFKSKAKKAGMTTRQYMQKVLSSPGRYSKRTVRQARLAKTLMGFHRRSR